MTFYDKFQCYLWAFFTVVFWLINDEPYEAPPPLFPWEIDRFKLIQSDIVGITLRAFSRAYFAFVGGMMVSYLIAQIFGPIFERWFIHDDPG